MGGKRTTEGERKVTLQLAAQQADLDIARVRIEQLQEMVTSLGHAITRVLTQPPFFGEKTVTKD